MTALEQCLLNDFNLAIVEARQSQTRAEYYSRRVATGIYKERIGKSLNFDKTPRTEQEIMQDEVETMSRHIDIAEQHINTAKRIKSRISFESSKSDSPFRVR